MKRTSTLQLGPTLREENKHKTKRETLQEEGSRQLAAERRNLVQGMVDTANEMDGVASRLARGISDDMRNMVRETFEHRGRDNFDIHSLSFGDYVPPVAQEADLPDGMPQGSLCIVHGTGELFVYTGERWVVCSVERDIEDRTTRVTIRNEVIEIRENGILRRDEPGEASPDSGDQSQRED